MLCAVLRQAHGVLGQQDYGISPISTGLLGHWIDMFCGGHEVIVRTGARVAGGYERSPRLS